MKDNEPESTPSILIILSPLLIRSLSVDITGSPAPTFVSYANCTPRFSAVCFNV